MTLQSLTLLLCSAILVHGQVKEDESQITITDLEDYTVHFRYLYRVPRSSLAALPRWTPLKGEVPLSPHKAASLAAEHLSHHFPDTTKLTIFSMSLTLLGAGRDFEKPELKGIWAYHVSFKSEPEPKPQDEALLNVMVLLDGTIVNPTISPLK